MAVTHWWLGAATATTATVVCRSNSTATVTVACNGGTFTGSANTGTKDGIVAVTVTGLSADSQYAYTIDGAVGGTLKTQPASGDVWIATGSCWHGDRRDVLADIVRQQYDLDLYIALGDFPYCETTYTQGGETGVSVAASVANSKDSSLYYKQHRIFRLIPGIKELMRNVPFMYMADDHEYPMDDAGPTYLTQYQAEVTGAGAALQADLDAAWTAARTAIAAYSTGFTPASGYDSDALYGTYSLPNVDVFLIDCINYRSSPTATDNASKTMLGTNQKTWLLAAVAASSKPFKLIATGKQLFKGGGNTDTFVPVGVNLGYLTERNEILYGLRNVTGVLWVAGDQHLWSDQWVAADVIGAGYPAVNCLCACPTSVDLNTTGVAGYDTGVRSKVNGYPQATSVLRDAVVGLFRFSEDRAYRYLYSMRRGLIPCGYVEAGSNAVSYSATRVG